MLFSFKLNRIYIYIDVIGTHNVIEDHCFYLRLRFCVEKFEFFWYFISRTFLYVISCRNWNERSHRTYITNIYILSCVCLDLFLEKNLIILISVACLLPKIGRNNIKEKHKTYRTINKTRDKN